MPTTYRPVLSREAANAIYTVMRVGIEHVTLQENELTHVLRFMNKISEREFEAQFLQSHGIIIGDSNEQHQERFQLTQGEIERLEKVTDPIVANPIFNDWDDETLEHFLLVYPDDPKADEVQAEIARRTRQKESQITRIRPPDSASEPKPDVNRNAQNDDDEKKGDH